MHSEGPRESAATRTHPSTKDGGVCYARLFSVWIEPESWSTTSGTQVPVQTGAGAGSSSDGEVWVFQRLRFFGTPLVRFMRSTDVGVPPGVGGLVSILGKRKTFLIVCWCAWHC